MSRSSQMTRSFNSKIRITLSIRHSLSILTMSTAVWFLLTTTHHLQQPKFALALSNPKIKIPTIKGSSSHHPSTTTSQNLPIADNSPDRNINNRKTKQRRAATFRSAKAFNSKLTQCGDASELLSCFMEQSSSQSEHGGVSSASTHLSGADRINSVNFSTCLHRLARFAVDEEERRRTLSDPRFALLVCSMAEMAAGVNSTLSVVEGNSTLKEWDLEELKFVDVGMREAEDILNTAVRLGSEGATGRNDHEHPRRERMKHLALDAMSRLSSSEKKRGFSSRECSNICWGLAKIRVAPPSKAFPLGRVVNMDISPSGNEFNAADAGNRRRFNSLDEISLDVLSSSLKVRSHLFEEARKRNIGSSSGSIGGWIPDLSRLAGKLMDFFAVQITEEYLFRSKTEECDSSSHGSKGFRDQSSFNSQEMASLLWAFAKSQRADDILFNTVAGELIRQTELMKSRATLPKPQEFSNTIWAFATAGIRGDTQVALTKLIADSLDDGDGKFFGLYFKPQELANTAWALATLHSKGTQADGNCEDALSASETTDDDGVVRILRWVAKNIQQQVQMFKPQELSNSVWAYATVGFGYDESCGANAHNDYVHIMSDSPLEDKTLVFDTLEIIADDASSRLEKFKAQEINNLVWGFARLGHRTEKADKLFLGIAGELSRRVHQFKPQDIGTTLWSLATVECYDFEAFSVGASRLNFQQIRLFKPQEMSNTLWALATAGFAPVFTHMFDTTLVPTHERPSMRDIKEDPITECFAAVAGETMRRPHEFKPQELKDVLWAFSKIGIRHPSLFKKIAEHIVGSRGFSSFSSQGLGNTVWSYAKQAQLSLDVIESLGLSSVKVSTTGRLAVYETSCLDIGENLIKLLFCRVAEAGLDMGLDRFKTQDISNTCWAYSTIGLLHSKFFREVEHQVISRLDISSKQTKPPLKGQEIANILWSFATLNAQPRPEMVDALSSYICILCRGKDGPNVSSIARIFKRQELANIAWSCAVIGQYPADLMNMMYMGMFGSANDPQLTNTIFGDNGLHKSSIMTMYYVQFAADVEAPWLKLSLPHRFPVGWGEDGTNESSRSMKGNEDDLKQTTSSMLTLTISKLQREVSETLIQVGFDNVLEHVIDAPVGKQEEAYGTDSIPNNPEEFLSIDIANVGDRLGVEVDGPGHFVRLIDTTEETSSSTGLFGHCSENRVNGPTILKHRLLTHLDWNIYHLSYWEYQSLGGNKEKEMAYCKRILDHLNNVK